MFFRTISDSIKISLTIPQYAASIFNLVEKNRHWLRKWLNWPDNVISATDVENFIKMELLKFQQNTGLHTTIFYNDKIAGVLGFNALQDGIGRAGYWLSKEYHGKGIMTCCLKELMHLGFSNYAIDRIEVHCTHENIPCRNILIRLNFKQTDSALNIQITEESLVEHIVYRLEREDFYTSYKMKHHRELCV